MTQYIYMNHRIRERKPSGPVIVAQDDLYGSPRVREADEFDLWFHGEHIGRVVFEPAGLDACETHDVKAWVELDDLVVVAYPKDYVPKPVAAEKKPNSKVAA
jgi:hypothetical protein